MYCTNCGERLEEDCRFCPVCGTFVDQGKEDEPSDRKNDKEVNEKFQEGVQTENELRSKASDRIIRNYNPDLDYNPIGMWGYFFYTILMNIPVIGWIFIILFSLGVTKKVNLRNFARSWLCIYIIAIVLFLIKVWPYLQLVFMN